MIAAIPTLVLTGAFVVTLLTNFGVLLQSLYLSRDMDFLVTSPLPMRAVFHGQAAGSHPADLCPVLRDQPAGFVWAGRLRTATTWSTTRCCCVMLVLLALAAGGLASILVMAVVRVVSGQTGGRGAGLCRGDDLDLMRPDWGT